MALKILPLLLLQLALSRSQHRNYQRLFLQRISPQYDATIYGDIIIGDHVYNRLLEKVSHHLPVRRHDFSFNPRKGRVSNRSPVSHHVPLRRHDSSFKPKVGSKIRFNRGHPRGRSASRKRPQPTQHPAKLGCSQTPAFCQKSKYRSYDGSCNNLRNPSWGTPQTRYNRLLPAKYGDGISTPTMAKSGNPLPSARAVSVSIYPDVTIEDPKWTLNAMQYGQIITHDMSKILGSTQTKRHSIKCCSADGQLLKLANNPHFCFPITVPPDDPAYSQQNISCMNFVRTTTDRHKKCTGGHKRAEQFTEVNHYLDLSIVYGNSDKINQQVRSFHGGKLITEKRNGQEWLPRNQNASRACTLVDPSEACYFAGDTRVNQNPQLTVLQTILLREHNRVADALSKINPHWDDETIFQEARKICIGQHQWIAYNEWLPIFIGLENALKNKIIWKTKGWVNDYDPRVNPTILNEHTTAAMRYFHTLIAGHLELVSEKRESSRNIRLSDWFNRPAILEQGNSLDELTRGLGTQHQYAADAYHDKEITLFWRRPPGQQLGRDLKAIDIQRNRDHGLASYNDYRHFCGLPKAKSFNDFLDVISKDNVERLASLYEHVDDVDLTVGGSLEKKVPGTLAGRTFLCILTKQFYRTRVGDRFWFENGGEGGFTLPQLNEIRKSSISRIMCDNGVNIKSMQPRGFEIISDNNAVVPCETLPTVDLSLWKDLSGAGNRKYPPQTLEN